MTRKELIAAERSAVDNVEQDLSRRRRLYAKMREFSERVAHQPLPNDVSIADAWLQLHLRAKDLAGVSDETGFYLEGNK